MKDRGNATTAGASIVALRVMACFKRFAVPELSVRLRIQSDQIGRGVMVSFAWPAASSPEMWRRFVSSEGLGWRTEAGKVFPVRWPLMTSMDDSYDLNLAAATLRSNSTDLPLLLKVLCEQLSDTLGNRMRVQRSGGRFKKSDAISSVQINIASNQFEAVIDGSDLRCVVGHFSGGIRIRSEAVDVNAWIVKLLEALQGEAVHSDTARRALENLVIGGNA